MNIIIKFATRFDLHYRKRLIPEHRNSYLSAGNIFLNKNIIIYRKCQFDSSIKSIGIIQNCNTDRRAGCIWFDDKFMSELLTYFIIGWSCPIFAKIKSFGSRYSKILSQQFRNLLIHRDVARFG